MEDVADERRAKNEAHLLAERFPGIVAIRSERNLGFAGGAVHDPVASLLLCASPQAAYTVVNGRVVVREGQLTSVNLGPLIERHNRLALQLAGARP